MLNWFGCYGKGWQNEILSEAFSHPAKFSRSLIRRIYDHAIERGWLAEGDVCLDPFAGVALGGLDAMFQGLHWIGVELEEKFVGLGQQNIDLWNRRYGNGMLPRWGTATLLQGDSRELVAILDGARAKGIVASPPYVSGGHHNGVFNTWGGQLKGDKGCAGWATKKGGYGADSANLGNMREGEFADAIVSSPAYAGGCAHTGGDDPKPGHIEGGELRFVDYGQSPGQLAAMAEGDVNAVIGSPPYAASATNGARENRATNLEQAGIDSKKWLGKRRCTQGRSEGYGQSPGQLAAMPEGTPEGAFEATAVVSSPPYEGSMNSGDENADARAERADGFKQGMDTFRYGQNPFTFLSKDPSGLNNQQRHELAARNPQMGALKGDTFWSAAKTIVQQCYQVLVPGGVAIWILKDFIRAKQRVPFCDQWRRMCEACGFETLEWIRAWLVEDRGAQYALNGDLVEKRVERKSFFRRLHETKAKAAKFWAESVSRDDKARCLQTSHDELWEDYRRRIELPDEQPPYPTRIRITSAAQTIAYTEAGKPDTEIETQIDYEVVLVMRKAA